MALICCPECGREISSKSKQCVHCGYPIDEENQQKDKNIYVCTIGGKEFDFEYMAHSIMSDDYQNPQYQFALCRAVSEYVGTISLSDAGVIVRHIRENGRPPETFEGTARQPFQVVCPRCGGTQITTSARGVNGFWGFIGASKTVNRCANCGKTWEPKR